MKVDGEGLPKAERLHVIERNFAAVEKLSTPASELLDMKHLHYAVGRNLGRQGTALEGSAGK